MDTRRNDGPLLSIVAALPGRAWIQGFARQVLAQDFDCRQVELVLGLAEQEGETASDGDGLEKLRESFHSVRLYKWSRRGVPGTGAMENEIFVYGSVYAKGTYLLFSDKNFFRSRGFLRETVAGMEAGAADLATTDLAVLWKDGNAALYDYGMGKPFPSFREELEFSAMFYGRHHLTNKVLRNDLWKRAVLLSDDFRACAGLPRILSSLVMSIFLHACARKVVHSKEYPLLVWKDEDEEILEGARHGSKEEMLEKTDAAMAQIARICRGQGMAEEDFGAIRNRLLKALLWRMGWAYDGWRELVIQKYRVPVLSDYDFFQVCKGRTTPIEVGAMLEGKRGDVAGEPQRDLAIQAFVCCDRPRYVPENRYLVPILVGSGEWDAESGCYSAEAFCVDDRGVNIAHKYRRYRSLTAQYYVQRNVEDYDFCGFFFHDLYFSSNANAMDGKNGIMDEIDLVDACSRYHIVVPSLEKTVWEGASVSVYEYFVRMYRKEDLEAALSYVCKSLPFLQSAMMDVLFGRETVMRPVFLMGKAYFQTYCEYLFSMLEFVEQETRDVRYSARQYSSFEFLSCMFLHALLRHLQETDPEVSILFRACREVEGMAPLAIVRKPACKEGTTVVPVCIACDDAYLKYAAVLLQSILEHADENKFYDLVVLHRNIGRAHQIPLLRHVRQKRNVMLRFCNIESRFRKYEDRLFTNRHLSLETYYRFLVMDLFVDYDKILYLDCDVVVDADIAELVETPLDGCYAGVVRDLDFCAKVHAQKPGQIYLDTMSAMGFHDWSGYFNAGVMLFNLREMRQAFTTETFFHVALGRSWSFHDQDVLNFIFHGKVHFFDEGWNVFWHLTEDGIRNFLTGDEPEFVNRMARESLRDMKILHCTGDIKPWDKEAFSLGNPLLGIWWQYARHSAFYEELLLDVQREENLPRMWFVSGTSSDPSMGFPAFALEITSDEWCSNYAVIDVIYLGVDGSSTDTLFIDARKVGQDETLEVKFSFEKSLEIFEKGIGYLNLGKRLVIWCRFSGIYTGYSFHVQSLESRNHKKPTISVLNENFVRDLELIPASVVFCGGAGADETL